MSCIDFSFSDTSKNSKASLYESEITKLRKNNQNLLVETDKFFKKLENPSLIQNQQQYSDDEKLCFCVNFFNLQLLHQILFKEKFPKCYTEWRGLINKIKFVLFGYKKKSLFWLDRVVIRFYINFNIS